MSDQQALPVATLVQAAARASLAPGSSSGVNSSSGVGGSGGRSSGAASRTDPLRALRDAWGSPSTASLLLAAALNTAVLGYVGWKLWRSAAVAHDKHVQLKRAARRLWTLATQGAEAAGPVPEDLGAPDEHGVYTKQSAGGDTLYFRQARAYTAAGAPDGVHWEFSRDKVLWIATVHADSLWYSNETSPTPADKVLIQRLEVEGQLLARHGGGGGFAGCGGAGSSACAATGALLPPLDLSQARRELRLADVPAAFLCPVSMTLMTQPVVTPSGATFDRPALLEWIRHSPTDPLSGQPLSSDQLVPNLVLRDLIHQWLLEAEDQGDAGAAAAAALGPGSSSSSSLASLPYQQPGGHSSSDGDASSSSDGGGGDGCRTSSSSDGAGGREAAVSLPATPVRTPRDAPDAGAPAAIAAAAVPPLPALHET